MAAKKRKKRGERRASATKKAFGFLANYTLDVPMLVRAQPSAGRPGIYTGTSAEGERVLVKVWPRRPVESDVEIAELWRHELRQLHRLAGHPGARGCIAQLHEAGEDKRGFYLALACEQRRPLALFDETENRGHWLNQPKQISNRIRIWRNLELLARGLESLHTQGVIHRMLDEWSVLTAGSEEPDFQLTGFEWSIRVVSSEETNAKRRSMRGTQHTFSQDWEAFGRISARWIGAKIERILDLKISPSDVSEHLIGDEVSLVRDLAFGRLESLVDGERIRSKISAVVMKLGARSLGRLPKLYIAFRLGIDSPITEVVRGSTSYEIEVADVEAQLAYIKDDLANTAVVMAVRREGGDGFRIILKGRNHCYRIEEFRPRGSPSTWEMGYSGQMERTPPPGSVLGFRQLDHQELELLTHVSALEGYPRLRGKLRSWNEIRRLFEEADAEPSQVEITLRALGLVQILEVLITVADVFSVEVVQRVDLGTAEDEILQLRTRPDPERDALSKALGLSSPAIRLDEVLNDERTRREGWILSDAGFLGGGTGDRTEWQFREMRQVQGEPDLYVFSGSKPAPQLRSAYLIPEGIAGEDVQYRRRLRALKALREHSELASMIMDPRGRIVRSHDSVTEDEAFEKLDVSKQQALQQLTSILPLYLVQGPPGVGKTRLVRDLVIRRFRDEPSSRMLLSAQSNSAVDHLLDELVSGLQDSVGELPLIVRCSSADSEESVTPYDLRSQSQGLIDKLARSPFTTSLPERLQTAIHRLVDSNTAPSSESELGSNGGLHLSSVSGLNSAVKSFEGAVARAANIVFATVNSAELERLIEERGQFDWSIIEEAGKATGMELVSPLLLSHRRLLIGDHKQLPPFGSDELAKLLSQPTSVLRALQTGQQFLGRALRDSHIDEIVDELVEEDAEPTSQFSNVCSEALRLLTLFETLIESEFARQKASTAKGIPIAARLSHQHRMQPEIADLVSATFYDGSLVTHPDCATRFTTQARPFYSLDPVKLPDDKSIVLVKIPYLQRTINSRDGERKPRWHNPSEVSAISDAISLLQPTAGLAKPPTLAILSPYLQQVSQLEEKVSQVSNLKKFLSPHQNKYFFTVDSFQGSEADIVIVSLVRNNAHSNRSSAFGFLTDSRRMNVLLSRARWMLMIVGSLEFFDEVLHSAPPMPKTEHLDTLMSRLYAGKQAGNVAVVDPANLRQIT